MTPTAADWKAQARTAHQQGQLAQAQQAYQNWLVETPDDPEALHGLGVCAIAEGRSAEATGIMERARELSPKNAAVHRNLGVAYWTLSQYDDALQSLLTADELEPDNPHTKFNLAVAKMGTGDQPGAIEAYEACLAKAPMHALAHSNLIFMLDLLADDSRAMEERRKYQERHGPPGRALWKPFPNPKVIDRRIRVGYVSGDYQFHSASFAFRPVFENHDRDAFEIYCYSATQNLDPTTEYFRDEFRWRALRQLPPQTIADGIRQDQIDILVDLSGHSKDNQLQVFTLKPAPIQVSAWGHALGTGLEAVDYLFSDPVVLPKDHRHKFVEEIVDLPSVICFQPQYPAPDVPPLPVRPLTFGGFQRLEKMSPSTFDLWASVMRAVPKATLIMKCPDLDQERHKARMLEALTQRGVPARRIELRGKTVHYEHLRQMPDCDVMLDTFPHGGGVSTLESLWMGVPVITLQGEAAQSRLASSFLTVVGETGYIATTPEEYVKIAVMLSRDDLAVTRTTLRDRMLKSPLCDHAAYTRIVEAHYREFWRRWCSTPDTVSTATP